MDSELERLEKEVESEKSVEQIVGYRNGIRILMKEYWQQAGQKVDGWLSKYPGLARGDSICYTGPLLKTVEGRIKEYINGSLAGMGFDFDDMGEWRCYTIVNVEPAMPRS